MQESNEKNFKNKDENKNIEEKKPEAVKAESDEYSIPDEASCSPEFSEGCVFVDDRK